jgi:hypothetical protein
MSGLGERQKALVNRLLTIRYSENSHPSAGVEHYAKHLFRLRKSKLFRCLPKTVVILNDIIDRLFDDFVRINPPLSSALNGDVEGFVRFSRTKLRKFDGVPAFAFDLMKFEAAIARARAADGFQRESDNTDFAVELVSQNFDLAPLFESGKTKQVLDQKKCRCMLWIDRRSGHLRVIEVSARSFATLRRLQRSGSTGTSLLAWLGLENLEIDTGSERTSNQ